MQKENFQMQLDSFDPGPPINESIVSFLDTKAANRILQLPVEIHAGPLGIESSYLRADNTEIVISLDTGAMSLDLSMHLRPYCNSYPCRVWLEGTWGPLVSGGPPEPFPVFAVRKVIGTADKNETNIRFPKQ